MPDVVLHAVFGRDVRALLPNQVRNTMEDIPYTFALFGPDVWFLYEPWKRREGRGRRMHTTKPGAFLMALADRSRQSAHPEALFSYLAGFLCHYALDTTVHPYIVYKTEHESHFPRGHMAFEHSLDILELRRAGRWGEKHPVTRYYFPSIRLPDSLEADLDSVFEEIYGWKHCLRSLNHAWARFRLGYRILENPKGWFARLARITGSPVLKSLAYSESHYNGTDVENTSRTEWPHSHDDSIRSDADFRMLRSAAEDRAVEMINGAWDYIFTGKVDRSSLQALIGNDSYLSGLPVDDPRNRNVASLLPPAKEAKP